MFAYRQSDSWLLLSLMYSAQKHAAALEDIIAAGDYINHSIFNLDELQTGFAKLIADGYVAEAGDKFTLQKKAVLLYKNNLSRHTQVHKQWELLNTLLPVSKTEPINTQAWSYPKLTPERHREAVEKYYNKDK